MRKGGVEDAVVVGGGDACVVDEGCCVGDAVVRGVLHSLTPQHDSFFHDPSVPCPSATPLTSHSFPLTFHLLHSPFYMIRASHKSQLTP